MFIIFAHIQRKLHWWLNTCKGETALVKIIDRRWDEEAKAYKVQFVGTVKDEAWTWSKITSSINVTRNKVMQSGALNKVLPAEVDLELTQHSK